MLGILANAAALIEDWYGFDYLMFSLAGCLLFISLIYVYKGQYPRTASSNKSLIYFGTIAEMKCSDFKDKFKNASNEEYLEDLLSQIHINAEILQKKFRSLKVALSMISLSVMPWMIAIYDSKMYLK